MKYPSLEQFVKNNFDFSEESEDNIEKSFDIISSCIEMVYNNEDSWAAADCTKKELKDFVEQLSSKQFKEIEKFFETMPKLSHTINVKNPKTGVNNGGIDKFFRLIMSHMDLEAYFRINFAMMQFHKYSLTEIENMIPWERDVYVGMLQQHIEDENLKEKQRQAAANA
jgi:hypothetical protein